MRNFKYANLGSATCMENLSQFLKKINEKPRSGFFKNEAAKRLRKIFFQIHYEIWRSRFAASIIKKPLRDFSFEPLRS